MAKSTVQLDTAIERFRSLLPENSDEVFAAGLLDNADVRSIEDILREFIHGSPAVREAASDWAHLIADLLEQVKVGTATKENALFVLEMAKKGTIILGETVVAGAKKKARDLFIDRILAYLRKIWPGGA